MTPFLTRLTDLLAKATAKPWMRDMEHARIVAPTRMIARVATVSKTGTFEVTVQDDANADLLIFLRTHAEAMGEVRRAAEEIEEAVLNVQFGYCGDIGNTVSGWPDVVTALTAYHAARKGLEDAQS